MRLAGIFIAAGLVSLGCISNSGCAYVGDPKPPALEIPTRILNLRAAEYGSKILVDFTLPMLTTEGLPVMDVMRMELRVTSGTQTSNLSIPTQEPGPVKFDFPVQEWIGKQATLTVRVTGRKGKTSEPSNAVSLNITAPLTTPADMRAVAVNEGVRLTWTSPDKAFWIFRSMGDQVPAKLGDADRNEYVDKTADFGTAYRYFVQASQDALHQSEISEIVAIAPVDTFAPAVPKGVSAVAGTDSIELAWERNTESDFAGYNIYRSTLGPNGGGEFMKIADRIEAPTYGDRTVMSGMKYSYAVTAIDQSGNESDRSMPVEVSAQ